MIIDEMQDSPFFKDWLHREKQFYVIAGAVAFGLAAYHLIFVSVGSEYDFLFTLISAGGGIYLLSNAAREKRLISRMSRLKADRLKILAVIEIILGVLILVFALTLPPNSIQFMQIIIGIIFITLGMVTRWRISRLKQLIAAANPGLNLPLGH